MFQAGRGEQCLIFFLISKACSQIPVLMFFFENVKSITIQFNMWGEYDWQNREFRLFRHTVMITRWIVGICYDDSISNGNEWYWTPLQRIHASQLLTLTTLIIHRSETRKIEYRVRPTMTAVSLETKQSQYKSICHCLVNTIFRFLI